jgi:hypothetical protein
VKFDEYASCTINAKEKEICSQRREAICNIKAHSYQSLTLLSTCDNTFDERTCSRGGLLLVFVESWGDVFGMQNTVFSVSPTC